MDKALVAVVFLILLYIPMGFWAGMLAERLNTRAQERADRIDQLFSELSTEVAQ